MAQIRSRCREIRIRMVNEIIKKIEELSGQYSGYEIFSDWIKAVAICISNQTDRATGMYDRKIYEKREDQYIEIAKKHLGKMVEFSNMTGMLVVSLENNMEDVLGKIYMQAGLGSKQTGQFFTPFHLSYLTAKIAVPEDADEQNPYIMHEPSTGGGGMIIAAAKALRDRGLNYQRCLKVVAQDIDWKGVYMTYVQLSLLGIEATVIQGDSLSGRAPAAEQIFYTPRKKGLIM